MIKSSTMVNQPSINVDTFFSIPHRVFLDTCVVNLLVDFGEVIFNSLTVPESLPAERRREVQALCGICDTGNRAFWQFIVSRKTFCEIALTRCDERRKELLGYFAELLHYQSGFSNPCSLPRNIFSTLRQTLRILPDYSDRQLMLDAVRDNCQAFCTIDRRTILNRRDKLEGFPCRVMTPSEWWADIRPWASTWL